MKPFIEKSMQGSAVLRGVRRNFPKVLTTAISCALLLVVPAASQAGSSGEITKQAGLGVGSALVSLVYTPVKIVYALGGLVVGGLAWVFSGGDNHVAEVVLTPSLLGDYVVTPKQLVGDDTIEFFGRDPDYQSGQADVAARPQSQDDQAW